MTLKFKPALAALALSVTSVALAAPASAVYWKSSSDPLYVYEDGVPQGKTYGHFYNDGQVSAMSTSWQYDMKPGGNNVRVETDFLFYGTHSGCDGTCWYNSISKQTIETNSAWWVKDARARNLEAGGEKARGNIDICEIQAFHNDPCSAKALPTFSY
ncbi:hypothetical protein [Nocardioides sp.]|uniref:hypothetical protein n=1 Tax=Nocardioides sp. TaxID=35761 RepID=UPI003D1027D3